MTRRPEAPRRGPRAVTSLQNERVKAIRALQMRKARRETGLFVAEGASVLISARDAGWKPAMLAFLAGSADAGAGRGLLAWAEAAGAECLEVSAAVLGKLAAKDNPQTVLAVFAQAWQALPRPEAVAPDALWLALEDVRDPGNLGTIVRTVHAVGGSGIVLVGNCVDPYAREAVRASMGSIFSVPLARAPRAAFLAWAADWPGEVVGSHLAGRTDYRAAAYGAPTLLVMGSEGPGLSAELSAAAARLVRIPMAGRLDSLNLAVAAALLLYEIRKDRLRL
jgi:TrmH family RNA methyltransferase